MTNEAREALREIEARADDSGDGDWFEDLVRVHGAAIGHWNVDAVHYWREWPGRTTVFPDSSPDDIAIDLVAEDAAGKRLIAIQCKARREGSAITHTDVDGFLSAAGRPSSRRRGSSERPGRARSSGRQWSTLPVRRFRRAPAMSERRRRPPQRTGTSGP